MMKIELFYQTRNGGWGSAGIVDPARGAKFSNSDIALKLSCFPEGEATGYDLEFTARYPTRVKIEGTLGEAEAWHLIPCCIHGDNNLANAKPGQYPNLTREYPEAIYSSPVWEFRADRASHPVSIAVGGGGEVGAISIDPYCRDAENHLVRNGVFAELPRLLERAGPGTGNGTITGLFTVLVDGDDHNEPIADAVRSILDGHIVLDRAIAERNRYPAINILRSISRTMPDCNTPEETKLVNKARKYIASYEDMAELIRLGAYKKGSDKEVDEAIFYYPKIEEFLSQKKNERFTLAEGYDLLKKILDTPYKG